MASIEELLAPFGEAAASPRAQLDAAIAKGRRVIGVTPYYIPEELVYAAGALPFGVWGAQMPLVEAKKYFPPFYCSICQTTLEMGLTHKLDKLSGIMITGLCDTLRAFSQNWKAGVDAVPMIYVSQPQNRQDPAGRAYVLASYTEAKRAVEECADAIIDDDDLTAAIKLYNQWRVAMRTFVELAGTHPAEVSVADRKNVIDASYFMDKADHLKAVTALNDALNALPESTDGFKKIVVSGIYEDIPEILDMFKENKFAIVGDDLAKESRAFAVQVPEDEAPLEALADGYCGIKEDSILFDPGKTHADKVARIAADHGAKGVVLLLAKFCDPEEFDAPFVVKACKDAGVRTVTIEVDQTTESYEQARTQLETFAELL